LVRRERALGGRPSARKRLMSSFALRPKFLW
jgi:hypothetical protein